MKRKLEKVAVRSIFCIYKSRNAGKPNNEFYAMSLTYFRHLASLAGLKELKEEYDGWGIDHSATRLIPDLNGVRPDAFYSLFPYEKGCSFLFYLEQKVGGAGKIFR